MIIKLQTTIAEQESDMLKLGDELYAQQKEIAELKRQYAELKGIIKSLSHQEDTAAGTDSEPPPPHY